jgi:hypothetical protein
VSPQILTALLTIRQLTPGGTHPQIFTALDGHVRLNRLEQRLSGRERDLRANAFARMHNWIDRVAAVGGLDGPYGKSIPGQSGSRVDVEISRGRAFVP